MGSLVMGAVGAGIGFMIGGPTGAEIGWMVGSTVGNIIDPPKGPDGPRVSDLKVQNSTTGAMLPIIYGRTTRIAGNMIWSTDLIESKHDAPTSGGKGGGGSQVYTYSVHCAIALCEGPIAGISRIWMDGKLVYSINDADRADLLAQLQAIAKTEHDAGIANNSTFMGAMLNPMLVAIGAFEPYGTLRVYNGSETQNPDPLIQSIEGPTTPAYRGTAYLVFEGLQLQAFSNVVPNIEVEVMTATATVGTILTDLSSRVGLSPDDIDVTQIASIGVDGFAIARRGAVRSMIQPLLDAFFFDGVESDDKIKFVARGNAPVLTIPESDLAAVQYGATYPEPLAIVRKLETELPYEVTAVFMDSGFYDQQGSAYSRRGVTVVESQNNVSLELPLTLSQSAAQRICDLTLYTTWEARTGFEFYVDRSYSMLEPADVISIEKSNATYTMRLMTKEEQKPGVLHFTAVAEDIDNYTLAEVVGPLNAQKATAQYNIAPGAINPPVIFEAPTALARSGLEIWFGLCGGGHWGGCNIWLSTNGQDYAQIGQVTGKSVMGKLTAPLYANGDPDTMDTLALDMSLSGGELYSVLQSDADQFNTASLIDGEVIAYQTATLTSLNQYTLGYLRRGGFGTSEITHATGATFLKLDGNVFKYPFQQKDIGKTVYFKFQSFNTLGGGLQNLSDVAAVQYAISGPNSTPQAPSNLTATMGRFTDSGAVALNWTASPSPNVNTYQIEYEKDNSGVWSVLPRVHDVTGTIQSLVIGSYQARVMGLNDMGIATPYVYVSFAVSAPDVGNVSGLELFNGATATTFTGRDAKFTWRDTATQDAYEFGQEPVGNAGSVDPYFRDYEVRLYDLNGHLLRTEHTIDSAYVYTFEKNSADGGGTPNRSFTIEVIKRGKQGQISVIPAQLTVANPQAGQVNDVAVTAGLKSLTVSFDLPGEPDIAGSVMWVSQTQGFTPDNSTLAYAGPNTMNSITVTPGVPYYIRLAAFDVFGMDGLNVSGEFTGTAQLVNVGDIVAGIIGESLLTNELASRISLIDGSASTPGTVAYQINQEINARTSGDAAVNARVDSLTTTVNNNTASITSEATTRASGDTALGTRIDTLTTTVNGNSTSISNETAARTDADSALGTRIDNLTTTVNNNTASITNEATARANADQANATSISQLSTTVNGNTAAIQTEATTRASQTGALFAQYSVKIDANGIVSGFGLASDGTVGGSEFTVRADKFSAVLPSTLKTVASITVSGTTATVTCNSHGYATGNTVMISGASVTAFNGVKTITVVDGNTFTYAIASGTASPAQAASGAALSVSLWQALFVAGQVNGQPAMVMSNAIIGDATIVSAMIGGAQIADNHIAASGISASKIKTGTIDASQQITVGNGNLVLDGSGVITTYGPGTAGQRDYAQLSSGNLLLYRYIAALGQVVQYNLLTRAESGQVNNNTLVSIPGYWKQQPKVMVSPASIQSYSANYSNQSQTLQCSAQSLVENPVGSGQWQFTALAQLQLASGTASGSPAVDGGSTSSDTQYVGSQASPFTTPANTTSITPTVNVSSKRGTGSEPNWYYRQFQFRVWYNNAGAWTAMAWSAMTAIGAGFNAVSASSTFNFPSAGTWSYYIEVNTSDAGGTFSDGGGAYNYTTQTMGPVAGPSSTSTANYPSLSTTSVTDGPGNSVTLALGSPTVPPGYSIYQVDYSYDWSLTSAYKNDGSGMVACNAGKLKVTSGNAFKSHIGTTTGGGTTQTTSGTDTYSDTSGTYNATVTAVAQSSMTYNSTQNWWAQSYASGFIKNAKAIVYMRQAVTNSATPTNDAVYQSYTAALASTTVLATGSLNWQAVGL